MTTQQGDHVAESVTWVPGVRIISIDGDRKNGRRLVDLMHGQKMADPMPA